MRDWMKHVPESEFQFYRKAGFGTDLKPGQRTALIVVDVTLGFCGSPGLSLEQAIEEFASACGPSSWVAMPRIAELIAMFRTNDLPIVYTLADLYDTGFAGRATKNARRPPDRFNEFPAAIAPHNEDWVLAKTKASAFFQTSLSAYLIK